MPVLMSCSEPMIEVSGVRSSWLSVEVNSFFTRSASRCAVTSRPWAMTAITVSSGLTSGVTVHSHITSMPSWRGLRMRPDRMIIGECRRAEALDMLQAMNTGVEGSMTTIHANTPRDAFSRL